MMDVPLSLSSNITLLKSSILIGSNPENGSSKSNISGLVASVLIRATG